MQGQQPAARTTEILKLTKMVGAIHTTEVTMRTFLLTILLLSGFLLPAHAADADIWNSVDTSEVEEQASDVLEAELTSALDFETELAKLGKKALLQLDEILRDATRSGGLILMISLFCSLLQSVGEGASSGMNGLTRMVGALTVTAVSVGDVHSLVQTGEETIVQLSEFTKVLMPALTTAAAAAGSMTGAAARQMATLIVSNLLLNLMTGLLIPLVYLYITACAGAEAVGNPGIGAIGGFIHWAVKTVLTWLLLLFTAYISISGVISGSADRAAVKLTRFAVSGMVPVVGGILSDATESVLVGAGLLRNTIGIYGTLAVLAFCILPFLRLGVQYLLYKIAAILTAAMTQNGLSKLIGEIGTAFGLVLAMTGTAAMVALISIITTISVAVG